MFITDLVLKKRNGQKSSLAGANLKNGVARKGGKEKYVKTHRGSETC